MSRIRQSCWMLMMACTIIAQPAAFLLANPQDPGGPVITSGPDEGSIENTGNVGNQIHSWVARSGNRAVAIHTYTENSNLMAKFRIYEKDLDLEIFKHKKMTIGTTTDMPFVTVRLVQDSDPNVYKMNYILGMTETLVGRLRFSRGKNGRSSSDVSIRLLKTAIPQVPDPCTELPADDVGEEELIGASTNDSQAPVASIPLGT